jgi:DNA-binding XRE family transcriptional regulator
MRRVPRKRSKPSRTDRRSASTSTLHHKETARFRKLNELLAKRLRRLRLQRGLTIEQASEAAGVEPITWYRLEHRRSNPTLAVLASVAAVFDLTVATLLDDE